MGLKKGFLPHRMIFYLIKTSMYFLYSVYPERTKLFSSLWLIQSLDFIKKDVFSRHMYFLLVFTSQLFVSIGILIVAMY